VVTTQAIFFQVLHMTRTPRLSVVRLEPREVPAVIAVGTEAGSQTTAVLVNPATGATRLSATPFVGFTGGASVACGDVNGDRVPDLIAAALASGGPRVVVLDGVTGAEVRSFFAYDSAFTGGVAVACGDVNDDAVADIITAALAGGGPHVKVFDGASGKELRSFFAYDAGFTGGLNVAAADVTGDGRADVITGAGAGGAPHIKVFDGTNGREVMSTFAYDVGFRGGVNVSAGDFDADGLADVLTGAGFGGGPHVRCFTADGTLMDEAMVGNPASIGGVKVGCIPGGTNGDQLVATTLGSNAVTVYDGIGGAVVSTRSFLAGGTNLSTADPTAIDPVSVWNDVALRAIRTDRTPPPRGARALAIVHTAVFDAVNAITPRYQSYLPALSAPAGASAEAAAITAAHKTLVALFPAQAAKFDAIRAGQLAVMKDFPADWVSAGVAVGEAAAAAMLADRTNDLGASPPYTNGTNPGEWRPTLPANAAFVLPGWGELEPFTMSSGDQFRPIAPPALTDAAYTTAFNEVKELGSRASTTRTADQTQIALFWAAGGGTDTPPGMTNRIAQDIVARENLSLVDTARTFALVNLAMADAAITSWDAKRLYNYWRPITAVREADTDGNAATAADPAWLPLIATPPFPAYTSGHSTFSSAGAAVLTALFGDTPFTTWSPDLPGVARSFTSFTQSAAEAGMSRIYGGIHYQFDNTYGLSTGTQIGQQAVANFLRPV
jgi:membrane-associated phospholipid phosphatase